MPTRRIDLHTHSVTILTNTAKFELWIPAFAQSHTTVCTTAYAGTLDIFLENRSSTPITLLLDLLSAICPYSSQAYQLSTKPPNRLSSLEVVDRPKSYIIIFLYTTTQAGRHEGIVDK